MQRYDVSSLSVGDLVFRITASFYFKLILQRRLRYSQNICSRSRQSRNNSLPLPSTFLSKRTPICLLNSWDMSNGKLPPFLLELLVRTKRNLNLTISQLSMSAMVPLSLTFSWLNIFLPLTISK